ncbi:MAG TPA: PAS domain S-box protein [Kiritimatiellia bacterium]|nr:PAS domain S-box protein [Kiritimatiellia bacterium]
MSSRSQQHGDHNPVNADADNAHLDAVSSVATLMAELDQHSPDNIQKIVTFLANITGASGALYNRLLEDKHALVVWAGHHLPEDLPKRDHAEGHICYEATILGKDRTVILHDLLETPFIETDPCVSRYQLRSYLGHPVRVQGRVVGSLAAIDTRPHAFTPRHEAIISLLARLVSVEEERLYTHRRSERLNRVLQTVRGIGHLLLMEKDRRTLIHGICEMLIARQNYRGAWMVLYDPDQRIASTAHAGLGEQFSFLEQQLLEGRQPVCVNASLQRDGVVVIQNLQETCAGCPMIEACQGCGALSLALRHEGRIHGILTIAAEPEFIDDPNEHALLAEIGADMARAFHFAEQEERLRQQDAEKEHELLLSAIEQSSDVIYITDTSGAIQYVNPAFELATGYRRDEVLGLNPRMMKSGYQNPAFYRAMWAELSQGKTWYGRFVNRRKDGALYTVETSISPIRDEQGSIVHYVAVNRDITRELAEEREKNRLQDQLNQAQKLESIGRLAGGVAHDFNNTLQIILGHAEAVLNQPLNNNFIRDSVQEMQRTALRSAGLTRQLLAFARQQTVCPKVFDLNTAVESMLSMVRRLVGEDIDLAWKPELVPAWICMDPAQLDQILVNLAVNARDAIDGTGRLTIEAGFLHCDPLTAASLPDAAPGTYVTLRIDDDGCGMEPEIIERIFEPFFTTKEVGKGTGLGLATVYGIMKQNNGFVTVTSAPGKGTSFTLYFPLAEPAAQETAPPPAAPISEPQPFGQGTILVVEDEPAIAITVQKFLEQAGYRVLVSDRPELALQLVAKHQDGIDLLLADVVMPGMSGRDLALKMTALYPEMKCLFMSGYTADIIAHRGVIDQSLAFLSKPFTRQELLDKVRETMAAV